VSNEPPAGDAGAAHDPVVDQLREALGRASELVASLSAALATAARDREVPIGESAGAPSEKPSAAVDLDAQEISERLVETEHQLDRLMSLYVATYQLHAFLDPREVHAAIADIAVNLLGAERFALVLRKEGLEECEIAFAQGITPEVAPLFAGESYIGGDWLVDASLGDGVLRLGPVEGSDALISVPLKIQEEIVGALVVLKLFDHKATLRPDDRDLLDLLSAHAASALFAARLFAAKDRKLRTLESLVKLARRE
jgi:nitrate/nitrite-specific signal transduction histidine kinase